MTALVKMANSISKSITFTADTADQHINRRVPMLDFESWVERTPDYSRPNGYRCELKHSFYEKPCTSKLVIMEKSAMPHRMKVVTLSQECVRRMKNTGRSVKIEERAGILSRFMRKLWRSGYGKKTRTNVLESGIKGYYSMLRTEMLGGRKINRPQEEGRTDREVTKIIGKSTWHLRQNGN